MLELNSLMAFFDILLLGLEKYSPKKHRLLSKCQNPAAYSTLQNTSLDSEQVEKENETLPPSDNGSLLAYWKQKCVRHIRYARLDTRLDWRPLSSLMSCPTYQICLYYISTRISEFWSKRLNTTCRTPSGFSCCPFNITPRFWAFDTILEKILDHSFWYKRKERYVYIVKGKIPHHLKP